MRVPVVSSMIGTIGASALLHLARRPTHPMDRVSTEAVVEETTLTASRALPVLLGAVIILIVTAAGRADAQGPVQQEDPDGRAGATFTRTSRRLPAVFEKNRGQAPPEVKFLGSVGGHRAAFTSEGVQFTLVKLGGPSALASDDVTSHRRRVPEAVVHVGLVFDGANPEMQVVGDDLLPGKVSYLVGPPSGWRRDIPLYAKVRYEGVYPGMDAVFYDAGGWLKYDFLLSPGADPRRIRLRLEGARSLRVTEEGDLVIETAAGDIRQPRPIVYQERGGTREEIGGAFAVTGNNVGFTVGPYDGSRPLVIDPQIGYSTYIGGNRDDQGFFPGLAVDADGNAYVSGETDSTTGQLNGRTTRDAFVAKVNPQGTQLLHIMYLGGSGDDRAFDVFVDGARNVYLTGTTSSPDFTGADPSGYVSNPPYFIFDTFLVKLSSSFTLIYSRYFGLGGGLAIAGDQGGNAYLSGGGFVDKFDPSGAHLGTVSFFSDGVTTTRDLQLGAGGNVYATGHHAATGTALPDAFVARISLDLTSSEFVLLPSGGGQSLAWALATDGSGNIYAAGEANPDPNIPSELTDAFVAKLAPDLSLVYLTHIGGSNWDQGRGVAADSSGGVYITGPTASTDFPTKDPFTTPLSVGSFVTKLTPDASDLVWSTLIGGNTRGEATMIALDGLENVYVYGRTSSTTGLIGTGGLQPTYGGGQHDTFLIQIRQQPTVEISLLPATTRWKPQRDTTTNIDIKFSSLSPLKSATITITGPSPVAAIQATFDPANPPNPYVITWSGPWTTDQNNPWSYLQRGNYTISVRGVKADDSIVESSPTDPDSTVSLVEVTSVELLAADDDPREEGALTNNPAVADIPGQDPPQGRPGGGKRIFAEARTRTEPILNKVKVRATVTPAISDLRGQPAVKVYFRALDVDDPASNDVQTGTANLADADGDNVPLDRYNVHDNRGDPRQGTVNPEVVEIPLGQVAVTTVLQTSVQPGDNYRVVASTSTPWRDDLRAYQPSQVGEIRHYSNDATLTQDEKNSISDMLTVWRTLHLEVDSMRAPPTDPNDAQRNFLQGRVSGFSINYTPPGPPPDTPPPNAAFLEPDETVPPLGLADGSPDLATGGQGRFEKGTICIGAIGDPPVQPSGDCSAPAVTLRPVVASGADRVEFNDEVVIPCTLQAPGGSTASPAAILWDGARFLVDGRLPSTFVGGTLDLGGVHFRIRSVYSEGPTIPPPTTTYIDVESGPELRFHLVDDDAASYPFTVRSTLLIDCQGDAACEADPGRNIFAQAYVTVRYDLPSARALALFQRNVPHASAAVKDQLASGRDAGTVSSLGYWAGYIQGAFQEDVLSDGDPDLENLVFVVAGTTADFVATFGSLVFVEAIRDYSALPSASCAFELIITETMAHELGHQFGLRDGEGGIMTQGCNLPHYFEAYSLGTIRNRRDPQ